MRALRKRREEGFTLIEVLVTMLLLAITFLGLAAIQISVIRNVGFSRSASEATRLAQSRIEFYQSMTFASVNTFVTTAPRTTGAWIKVAENVAADGVNPGPYRLEDRADPVGPTVWVITARATWHGIDPSGNVAPRQVTVVSRVTGP